MVLVHLLLKGPAPSPALSLPPIPFLGAVVTPPFSLPLGRLSLQGTSVTCQPGDQALTLCPALTCVCPAFPRSPQGTSWSS